MNFVKWADLALRPGKQTTLIYLRTEKNAYYGRPIIRLEDTDGEIFQMVCPDLLWQTLETMRNGTQFTVTFNHPYTVEADTP